MRSVVLRPDGVDTYTEREKTAVIAKYAYPQILIKEESVQHSANKDNADNAADDAEDRAKAEAAVVPLACQSHGMRLDLKASDLARNSGGRAVGSE